MTSSFSTNQHDNSLGTNIISILALAPLPSSAMSNAYNSSHCIEVLMIDISPNV